MRGRKPHASLIQLILPDKQSGLGHKLNAYLLKKATVALVEELPSQRRKGTGLQKAAGGQGGDWANGRIWRRTSSRQGGRCPAPPIGAMYKGGSCPQVPHHSSYQSSGISQFLKMLAQNSKWLTQPLCGPRKTPTAGCSYQFSNITSPSPRTPYTLRKLSEQLALVIKTVGTHQNYKEKNMP